MPQSFAQNTPHPFYRPGPGPPGSRRTSVIAEPPSASKDPWRVRRVAQRVGRALLKRAWGIHILRAFPCMGVVQMPALICSTSRDSHRFSYTGARCGCVPHPSTPRSVRPSLRARVEILPRPAQNGLLVNRAPTPMVAAETKGGYNGRTCLEQKMQTLVDYKACVMGGVVDGVAAARSQRFRWGEAFRC